MAWISTPRALLQCGDAFKRDTKLAWTKRALQQTTASIQSMDSDDVMVSGLIGNYGYMNISSYSAPLFGGSLGENNLIGEEQNAVEGKFNTRLYSGRIRRGPRTGMRVLLKAYPSRSIGGAQADIMATNEFRTHAVLQDPSEEVCSNISVLLGGFETRSGEQWLVFRDDGLLTASDYVKAASEATVAGKSVGEWQFLDLFDRNRSIMRRQKFIVELLRGIFVGLSYMHSRQRLHQSIGPSSVLLNLMEESEVTYFVPRLRDLAFTTDISAEALYRATSGTISPGSFESSIETLSSELWHKAEIAGARTVFERKSFGIADDIYSAGFLCAYIVFASLSQPGSIDGRSLQRLFESTFRLDIMAAREYCLADDRWEVAVKFLDMNDKAGWELLQAMLNPDYRQRPIADSVLCHRFMTR